MRRLGYKKTLSWRGVGELCPCGKEDCGDGGPAVVCGVQQDPEVNRELVLFSEG